MFNKLSILFYLIFSKTNAFIPNHNLVPRNTIIRRSHFSTIQTSFTDKDILFQTLKELDYQVINNVENIAINSYDNENTIPEIIIKQSNGYDIGFKLDGKDYQLVSDLQFWNLPIPVSAFLEKITQKYALNSVLYTAKENDYVTDKVEVDPTNGTIEVEISRYTY